MTEITRPQPPSARGSSSGEMKPEDYNPEMAAASMAKDLINRMGTPAILSQKFVVWHGITRALNHENPTFIKVNAINREHPTLAKIDTQFETEKFSGDDPTPVGIAGKKFTHVAGTFYHFNGEFYEMINAGNPTGIDTSLRLQIYDHAAKNSVNVDGRYFTAVWTYLNKPNLTVVQPGQLPGNAFQDDQPSLGRRILNKFTGGGNNGQPNNPQ